MNRLATLVWLLVPIALIAWHFGPGQGQLSADKARLYIETAREAASRLQWQKAADRYGDAINELPEEAVHQKRRLELEQARALIQAGKMVEGQEQLESLLDAMEKDTTADKKLLAEVRNELATSSYFAAWLMRLEGATEEEWLREAERARQQFRVLAENAAEADADGEAALDFKKNVEAVVRLEQMDLSELLAKPLPKNCPNCEGGLCQAKRKQAASRCKSGGKQQGEKEGEKKEEPTDVRSTGASLHERRDGGS
jgi:hypothetical protein